jgi:flagellin-like hook-associated protein FlgL
MSLLINTNTQALNAQRQLVRSSNEMATSMERLASGKRINSAADDAAGLVLSNRMTSQIRGLGQAVRNANDGISMIQTAEGALDESTGILQRMRELAVQSANGVYGDGDRATLDAEVQQLANELNRVAATTSFNGQTLLDGTSGERHLQVGAEANQVISFTIPAMDTKNLGMSGSIDGDVFGAEINLDINGFLTNAVEQGSVKINGRALGAVEAGSNLQALLDQVEQIGDLQANTFVSLEADNIGDGVLSGGDTINITGVGLDGVSQTVSIQDTDSLDDLVETINSLSAGKFSASLSDAGKLVIASDSLAKVSVSDSTQGVASGMSVTTIEDADIAATLNGLQSHWISEAEDLISTYFGLDGDANGKVNLTLNLDDSDGVGQSLASVSWVVGALGTDLHLNIDMADFTADNQPDGGSAPVYNDRIIAHEMVHAVMTRNMNMSALPGWFTEGAAELIHGADERVIGDFTSIDSLAELDAAFKTSAGSPSDSAGYSVGYLATKMLHDDLLFESGGAGGIDLLFDQLEAGNSLDVALGNLSVAHTIATWSDLATFEAHFRANGVDYLNDTYANNNFDLSDTDTGSIAGSDYGHGAKTAISILPNAGGGGANDFTLVIPAEYAGTSKTAEARLVLTSPGDEGIRITKGLAGSDVSLEDLGFREMSGAGLVLGEGLSESEQMSALAAGDLTINGVVIAAVSADAGLAAKLDAINAQSDTTGVVASQLAQQSYQLTDHQSVALGGTGSALVIATGDAGLLGINGQAIAVAAGATASDIAAQINQFTQYFDVTAYADSQGSLHLYSSGPVTLADTGGGLVAALGLKDAGNNNVVGGVEYEDDLGAGSLMLNGNNVSLSDLGDLKVVVQDLNARQGDTGVRASIDGNGSLLLEAASGVRLAIGDVNGVQTLATLGITYLPNSTGTEDLLDEDNDNLLHDEFIFIEPRILLDSLDNSTISLDLSIAGAQSTGLSDLNADLSGFSGAAGLESVSVATQAQAQDAISSVDSALEAINGVRSELGAVNNRLDFTISNLMNIVENTQSARSRINDADFAGESAALSRAQVLQQAAQAMLAQANSRPSQVLSLLQA